MNEKTRIYEIISKNPGVSISEIIKLGNFSQRTYVSRLLSQLTNEHCIRREKRGRNVYYFVSDEVVGLEENLELTGLHEDEIWAKLRKTTSFLNDISEQAENILYFAFTEMLNNAIDHSHSGVGYVKVWLEDEKLKFIVKDGGVGVFRNVMIKKHFTSETEAIQEIVKGKLTTAARRHSGEGIFWTSKIADQFRLKSYEYELIIDNNVEDYVIKKTEQNLIGTEVYFEIAKNTDKSIRKLFRDYTFDTENLTLDTTVIPVNLYSEGDIWISRSQAKKVLAGLEKYKKIIFNFAGVEVIGQAFADEIFRVFNIEHPDIILEPINMSDSVKLMVSHAVNDSTGRE